MNDTLDLGDMTIICKNLASEPGDVNILSCKNLSEGQRQTNAIMRISKEGWHDGNDENTKKKDK